MPIGYSQEGYRPTTALANLTSQGIGPIDVTRGGSIQYAPLAQISIPSSQPELVAQGIASGIQSAASGAFSGIKANWEADQETKLEKAKQETLLGQKAEERIFQLDKERASAIADASQYADAEERIAKFDEAQKPVRDRILASVPSQARKTEVDKQIKKETPKYVGLDQDYVTPKYVESDQDYVTPKSIESESKKIDLETPLPETDVSIQQPSAILSGINVNQEQQPKSILSEIQVSQPSIIKEVDYNKSPRPELPEVNKFKSDAEANRIAENLTNKDWNAVVEKDKQGWNVIKLEDRYQDRVKEEQSRALASKKETREQAEFLSKQKKQASEEETQKALSGMTPVKTTIKPGGEIQTEYKPQVPLRQQVQQAESSIPQLDVMLKTINDIKKISPKGGVIGFRGVGGESAIKKYIPFTTAYDVDALLGNLKGNIAIKSLQEMRQNSPTGGALGNVSDKDLEMMQNLMGTLNQSVSPEIFYENLNSLQDRLQKTKSQIEGSVSEIKKGFAPIQSGSAEQGIPLITSNEQFKSLPSGSTFKDPTGKIHTKK